MGEWSQKQIIFTIFEKDDIQVEGEQFVRWMEKKHPEVKVDQEIKDIDSLLDEFVEDTVER